MNKPLWGQDMWKDVWVHLQKPEAVLTVFHIPAHKVLTPSDNQEPDVLAGVRALLKMPDCP